MNRESPGSYRQRPERHREQPGRLRNNRDGTVAPPGPIQTPAELRQRPGECRCSPGKATVYKKTGALPERHRHPPGLRRGITGDDRSKTGALP
ncbi:hypothetical protein DPMN_145013 [Dreissena polymorpha]|uniref:Uncharacterized protein n=1 Tax=Dreissena polymorpha TaxID=45954 RepID=A0A9D4IYE7_DREPO|nr:hypothetical protein DPMN_145013 [Dreissena polymorpha]